MPINPRERKFCIDNLLVRIHFIIEMIWWTGLTPWELGLPFSDSLTSTFHKPHPLRSVPGMNVTLTIPAAYGCSEVPLNPIPSTLSPTEGPFFMSEVPL